MEVHNISNVARIEYKFSEKPKSLASEPINDSTEFTNKSTHSYETIKALTEIENEEFMVKKDIAEIKEKIDSGYYETSDAINLVVKALINGRLFS